MSLRRLLCVSLVCLAVRGMGSANAGADPLGELIGKVETGESASVPALMKAIEEATAADDGEAGARGLTALHRSGHGDEAEALGRRLLAGSSLASSPSPLVEALARVLDARGKPLEAAEILKPLVEGRTASSPEAWKELAGMFSQGGDLPQARASLQSGLAGWPGSALLQVASARLELLEGRGREARNALEALVQSSPHLLMAWETLVEADLAEGDLETAGKHLSRFQKLAPTSASAMSLLALLLKQQGDSTGAESLLLRAETLAGTCHCTEEERQVIRWARTQPAEGGKVSPRRR